MTYNAYDATLGKGYGDLFLRFSLWYIPVVISLVCKRWNVEINRHLTYINSERLNPSAAYWTFQILGHQCGSPPAFRASVVMTSIPGAFLFSILVAAFFISSGVIYPWVWATGGGGGISSTPSGSCGNLVLRCASTCSCEDLRTSSLFVCVLPLLSLPYWRASFLFLMFHVYV